MTELAFSISSEVQRRVFLATADSAIQPSMPRAQIQLERQIKALALMGYNVLIGTPFVWQSEVTRRAITHFEPLIEARVIGLMGRPGISSATDYLHERLADTARVAALDLPPGSPFKAEVPREGAAVIAKHLDVVAPLIPRRASVEKIFIRSYLDAFSLQTGTLDQLIRRGLPTKYSQTAWNRAEALVNHLQCLPFQGHFSRAVVAVPPIVISILFPLATPTSFSRLSRCSVFRQE